MLQPACQCARFSLKNGLYRPLNPQNFRCAALEGGAAPPPSRQIATLTATIIHAPFGPPVDVLGQTAPGGGGYSRTVLVLPQIGSTQIV